MATREEVKRFLNSFQAKLSVFNIIFCNRDKNIQALADLEITPLYRETVIKEITVEDYSEGPKVVNNFGEMWVFGKDVKQQEVYIKISLGHPNSSTICISFHKAEYPIKYPFKN